MRVRELMTKEVKVARPEDTLGRAAQLMWDADCGDLPVVDGEGRLLGIITDRDICIALAMRDQTPSQTRVESVMEKSVEACRGEDDIRVAEDLMKTRQVRRVPVIDDQRRVIGIVSINDLALAAARAKPGAPELSPEAVIKTLAAVCAHRGAPASA